ncbi:NmrA/HSCARG family protein [Streptomyces sp. NRRL B-1347]|uniref:NmrA/HSCARG family protein n=1 Tax=Streptomyces sp. NRRL B-1347 TaxID=1476877 RepID=UPI0004C950FA|nr:NmrA/HSCARG family protein [Streptomyces sp. NRRL B-1347]
MTELRTILVTGATGLQGGAVARALLARGYRVRALTRAPDGPAARELARAGAVLVAGDFDDPASVGAAAEGADSVYLMSTPLEQGPAAETRQALGALEAVVAAGVRQVVHGSAAAADQHTGIDWFDSKIPIEKAVRQVPSRWTIVAPVVFMDVVRAPHVIAALRYGQLAMALPSDRPLQYVDVRDIGGFVAQVVERPEEFSGQRVEIASDRLTGPQLAAVLAGAAGRPVSYAEMELEQLRAYGGEQLETMFRWFARVGFSVDVPALHTRYPEVGWHDFAAWAGAQDWSELDARE